MNAISHEALRQLMERSRSGRAFLKWAGGKQPFLAKYADRLPPITGRYIEPFMGSASVFFLLKRIEKRPFWALLADTNLQLVKTFLQVRDQPQEVLEDLAHLVHGYSEAADKTRFYKNTRESYNLALPKVNAATFIFLNRTCWNGLYRVNRTGKFNVPYGKGQALFPTEANLLNASASLAHAEIRSMTWQNTLATAEAGDFVFADPPYFSDCSLSAKYSKEHFTPKSHEELALRLSQLAERGVDFMLTNSGEREMIELYQSFEFDIEVVSVPRFISSKTDARTPTAELIVRPRGAGGPTQLLLGDELAEVVASLDDDSEVPS